MNPVKLYTVVLSSVGDTKPAFSKTISSHETYEAARSEVRRLNDKIMAEWDYPPPGKQQPPLYWLNVSKAVDLAVASDKNCQWCGIPFTPVRKVQVVCSRYCRDRVNVSLNRKRKQEKSGKQVFHLKKNCIECGTEFLILSSTHRTCTKECRRKHRTRYMNEYLRKYRTTLASEV